MASAFPKALECSIVHVADAAGRSSETPETPALNDWTKKQIHTRTI